MEWHAGLCADANCGDVMARGDVKDWHPVKWRPVGCDAVGQRSKTATSLKMLPQDIDQVGDAALEMFKEL